MRKFRKLEIWKRSFELVKVVYKLCNDLPESEKYGLVSQVKRCSVSIPSNIAEGCGRVTNTDLNRFIAIAIGSTFELESQLLLISDLFNTDISSALQELNEIQKMLNGFSKSLKPNS